MIKIVTHSGGFHADDVFAIATFELLLGKENIEVVRTRDEAVIAAADYVVDVGGVYDDAHRRFDHHQPGAPVRENGIPYAGFGLVWKHYGAEVCGDVEVARVIDEKLCQPIDAGDNGLDVAVPTTLGLPVFSFDKFIKEWRVDGASAEETDIQFAKVVVIMKEYLVHYIANTKRKLAEKALAERLYEESDNKKVIVSDVGLSSKFFIETETEVVVFPEAEAEGNWLVSAVPLAKESMAAKVHFPESWAGLRDKELSDVAGIDNLVFCHKGRHFLVAGNKEAALVAVGFLG